MPDFYTGRDVGSNTRLVSMDIAVAHPPTATQDANLDLASARNNLCRLPLRNAEQRSH
jgi:hypothetical protein